MRSGLRSFEGVFRILFPLLIEFARKIYLKYFEFVHAIWKEERFLDCLNPKNNVSSNTSLEYKSPHRYSALLSPSLVKTFSTYFKFLANPLAKRQFLGRTISNSFDSKENRSIETCSFSLFLPERIKFKNLWGRERDRIYLETIKFVPG